MKSDARLTDLAIDIRSIRHTRIVVMFHELKKDAEVGGHRDRQVAERPVRDAGDLNSAIFGGC